MSHPILYVEDNPDHAELVLETLAEQTDVEIAHVRDGAAALDWLDDHDPPRLILLDLRLPKLGGLAVLERIKQGERWSHVPVVVLTTSAAPADLASAYANGANAYLVKPTRLEDLERLLSDLHSFWLRWNRPLETP